MPNCSILLFAKSSKCYNLVTCMYSLGWVHSKYFATHYLFHTTIFLHILHGVNSKPNILYIINSGLQIAGPNNYFGQIYEGVKNTIPFWQFRHDIIFTVTKVDKKSKIPKNHLDNIVTHPDSKRKMLSFGPLSFILCHAIWRFKMGNDFTTPSKSVAIGPNVVGKNGKFYLFSCLWMEIPNAIWLAIHLKSFGNFQW